MLGHSNRWQEPLKIFLLDPDLLFCELFKIVLPLLAWETIVLILRQILKSRLIELSSM
jgi:hypothetical protein